MEIGKVSETILKRSILKELKTKRPEVLIGPGVGEDCAALALPAGEGAVLSCDPITGATKGVGTLAVHVTANDIASQGAEIFGLMLTILLPDGTMESELKSLIRDMEQVCEELNIQIMGGHTEITGAVNQPIVVVTGIGRMPLEEIHKTASLKPGQELIMTKWAGLEGTAILSLEQEEKLLTRYTREFLQEAQDFKNYLSVVPEARIASAYAREHQAFLSMHDITEGGVFGAIWEMAAGSGIGVTVDLKKIPIRQETVEICEFFDLNPYQLISSGCLLIGTDQGNGLLESLRSAGIPAEIIGRMEEGNDRVVKNGDETRFLTPPVRDELYGV